MNSGKYIYVCLIPKLSVSCDVIPFLSTGGVKNVVMQPEGREFCTALGAAVKQVKPIAGTMLCAIVGILCFVFYCWSAPLLFQWWLSFR